MKVLLAEYTSVHDPALAREGRAMLDVLSTSFRRCGYTVLHPGNGDFGEEIARLAPECETGLVIAPDHLLARYTQILEQHTRNLGCGFMTAALCANKVQTGKILAQHGIAVPGPAAGGRHVVKPVKGCGALGVRLTDDAPGEGEFAEEYIEGESLSVSIVANRIIGDACLYFSGNPPVTLAINRQLVDLSRDGSFAYRGGETPISHPRSAELISTARTVAGILGCQGYVGIDMVVADRIYVVDVNPRITTSIVGITACMDEEIAEILVAASKGAGPEEVHLSGRVRFDTSGTVTPV